MTAEILAVGTELLLGDILNTNAQFLSKELANLGISVYHQTVVGDNPERLERAFKDAFERADIVVTTGGLGPTKDDLTKETGARYFGKKLVEDPVSMQYIRSYFDSLGRQMTKNNEKQGYMPEGAIVLKNNNGTAPGCVVEENGKILIMIPGPPFEAEPMFMESVVPYLQEKTDQKYISKILRICGVGESAAEEMIQDLIETQTNPTIAPYAKANEMTFRITAVAKSEEEAYKIMEPTVKKLYNRFGDSIYAEGETTLEHVIVNQLIDKKLTLAVAESCTGGMLASRIVNVVGSSKAFLEGVVSYSNEAKANRLGVDPKIIEKYGAVSKQVAEEMAKGICKTAGTDVGVATTGIAGPDGGTDEKPVGLVYICVCIKGRTVCNEFRYKGSRTRIRTCAVASALDMLRREIKDER